MTISCKFELSRVSAIYYSAENVEGSLTICSLKPRQLQEIKLEFYGESILGWWELDNTKDNIMHNDFSAHEVSNKVFYTRQQKHVSQQLKLNETEYQNLQPHVVYTYKFCFAIPQLAPATYCCRYGQTNYGLRLHLQSTNKVYKEYKQKVIIKNKLDLTQNKIYKKSCDFRYQNEFGEINLKLPCSGFTPGQIIPYYCCYQTTQTDCKLLIQFNCYTTCYTQNNLNKFKQIKQIVNYKKHLLSEISSYVNVPLNIHTSSTNNLELVFNIQYALELYVFNRNKRVLLSAIIPLTIGTTPCCIFKEISDSYLCYDNFGSSSSELLAIQTKAKLLDFTHLLADQEHKIHLKKSLQHFYNKLIKYI